MAKKTMTFAGVMSKVPQKAWQEARKAEPGGKRELPVIEDGVYPCKATNGKTGVDRSNNGYFACTLVVLEGEYEGTRLDYFKGVKTQDPAKDLAGIVKTLKAMGYEISDKDPPTVIEEVAKDITENEPECMVSVKNDSYAATSDGDGYKKGDDIPTLRVWVNRPLSVEEGASAPAPKKEAKKAPAKKAPAKKTGK